jgi:RHS repeat-associated protein
MGNRLREVTGKETYRYDGHGRRVWASSLQGLGDIRSFYGQDGVLRYQRDDRQDKVFNHVYLGGSLVATRETPYSTGISTIKYQHTDALGSPVAVTDVSRAVIERTEYEPYGKVLNRPIHDGPGYTGHVEDAATGLTYMQQRYYDPGIGRFLSVDPVTANPKNGSNFNRYWYANNNPYRFTDPDGRYTCGGDKQFCAKIDGYVSALKDSSRSLRAAGASKKDEYKRVSAALTQIGKKGEGGPKYVPGVVDGRGSAKTDQHNTTTVEIAKIADSKLGAQNLAHEATHDIDVKNGGLKTTEAQVRETETNAYSASRAVDSGFGAYWTEKQFQDAINDSMKLWKDQQPKSENED